jgi:hypothetical protein
MAPRSDPRGAEGRKGVTMRGLMLSALTLAIAGPALSAAADGSRPRFVIDADTANEVDDPASTGSARATTRRAACGRSSTSTASTTRGRWVLFDAEGLELHVMPHTTAATLSFDFADLRRRLGGRSELDDFLVDRWRRHVDAARRARVIWDLALVEAVIRPALARQSEVQAPPENGGRRLSVYTWIDADAMRADFYERLRAQAPAPTGTR